MVTITGYSTREGVSGKNRVFLHLESELIPKSSKTSGRTYFITKKARVLAAIDEELAQQLICLLSLNLLKNVSAMRLNITKGFIRNQPCILSLEILT